ncbi:hypothetical protein F4813DRAFT_365923 [Daldinia decipiens]|uniref:uncharacterized protein n=1 Tax=Daldinia decipiens TaxID=326647 RepID=UPI0020C44BE8|nr:uncharacterized protein F4813DRAFT_365923 [Daldinia decipiens]KAI1655964.1 hypothetical protein F4813DRAFT_365923 [Daldinia decipiens]
MTMLTTGQQIPKIGNLPAPQTQQLGPRMSYGEVGNSYTISPNVGIPSALSSVPKPPEEYIDFPAGFRVSVVEADQVLFEYRTTMQPSFPYVNLPPWSAREMLQDRPLLLKAIIYVCRPQPWPVKCEIEKWFREYFALHVVVQEERSLELLQAILIYIAWQVWHFFVHAHDSSLMQLAIAMVGDMGLNRPPDSQTMPSRSIIEETTILVRGMNIRKEHTHAERRTLLGVFYISSVIRSIFRRTEPMEFTEYVGQCCNELTQAMDCSTDQLAVTLVRMQHLVLQATKIVSENSTNGEAALGVSHVMAMTSIRRQLDDIVNRLPEDQKSNFLVWHHYHMVLIRLYEPVIDIKSLDTANKAFMRSQALWTCCQSAKSLLELYLTIPGDMFAALSFVMIAHLSYSNIVLTHLLFLEDQDWDAHTARESVNYPDLTERLSDYFVACEQLLGRRCKIMEDGKGLFTRSAERMRWAKSWYLSKLPFNSSMLGTISTAPMAANEMEYETWQILFA